MNPSWASPYDGAPASWVLARARPNSPAASVVSLPGSTQARIRQSFSTASTSGTWTPPASPSQRSPSASVAKKPSGALVRVFMNAERPLLSRSLVAVEMSPPATGAVAATADHSSSSARRATWGWRVTRHLLRSSRAGRPHRSTPFHNAPPVFPNRGRPSGEVPAVPVVDPDPGTDPFGVAAAERFTAVVPRQPVDVGQRLLAVVLSPHHLAADADVGVPLAFLQRGQ